MSGEPGAGRFEMTIDRNPFGKTQAIAKSPTGDVRGVTAANNAHGTWDTGEGSFPIPVWTLNTPSLPAPDPANDSTFLRFAGGRRSQDETRVRRDDRGRAEGMRPRRAKERHLRLVGRDFGRTAGKTQESGVVGGIRAGSDGVFSVHTGIGKLPWPVPGPWALFAAVTPRTSPVGDLAIACVLPK